MDGKNEQLAAIRARREAVTPGVWSASLDDGQYKIFVHSLYSDFFAIVASMSTLSGSAAKANAAFIAAAPADIDTLLAHVAALTAERDALAQQAQQAQAQAGAYADYCHARYLDDATPLPFAFWSAAKQAQQAATTPSA